ncbi:cytochrome P450 [Streptomyces sp. AC550_RSS872]|uniref:cytochrome P450 n=1 Tax=Streptomyces sp. AC550_RSS872 TaxID=2823689 RepID=UPI001C263BAB|nr:cytochrome P450 [Streptomyces sp. AC550_RSS872]
MGALPQAGTDTDAEELFESITLNPMSEDPYPEYARLRSRAPVLLTTYDALVLSRHAECDQALRHRSLGKSTELKALDFIQVPQERLSQVTERLQCSMLYANPPDHTRLRRGVNSAFSGRHVEALRPQITARVDQLLDGMFGEPAADFMSGFAYPLPIQVISDLLGIPESDREAIANDVDSFAAIGEPTVDPDVLDIAIEAEARLASYFADLLRHKRRHQADDLLTRLATETALTELELVSTAQLLLGAGIDTTSNQLGNILHALLAEPGRLDRMYAGVAVRAPGSLGTAVDELIRYDPPLQFDARTVLEPVEFAGAKLEPEQTVIMILGAANRDPERFRKPDELLFDRADNPHLSFASGIHFCLGAYMARLDIQIFLERLRERGLVIESAAPAERRESYSVRGFARMPIRLRYVRS